MGRLRGKTIYCIDVLKSQDLQCFLFVFHFQVHCHIRDPKPSLKRTRISSGDSCDSGIGNEDEEMPVKKTKGNTSNLKWSNLTDEDLKAVIMRGLEETMSRITNKTI